MDQGRSSPKEQRKFIRLDSVLPVQFRMISPDGQTLVSDWQQGFTNNVCRSGIALVVNNLNPELAEMIKQKKVKLSLDIEIPLTRKILNAKASIVWVQQQERGGNNYLVGLLYEAINSHYNNMIMRFVFAKRYVPRIFIALLVALTGLVIISGYFNNRLIKNNKGLIAQLVGVLQDSSAARQKIKDIAQEKEGLELKIQALQSRIQTIEEKRPRIDLTQEQKLKQLDAQLGSLSQEKSSLERRLSVLQDEEGEISTKIMGLDKKRDSLEKANLDKMHRWLTVHQNPRTGLVISFEGDNELAHQAFTYDQALAAQTFTRLGDFTRAQKILQFFAKKAKRIDGQFLNAYYSQDGNPAEYTVRVGPNIWLGIAIMQYTHKSKDYMFLDLAKQIASTVIYFQQQDEDGGIRGGPDVEWYSTEHNLDAYAFFSMLYQITGEQRYRQAQSEVLDWLALHTYDKTDVPVKRGKGDSSIATDTYAWSIAALGPETLLELGMDPDKILEFAEDNCSVRVSFSRPEGKAIAIKGFDFAPQRHLARGGVVSSEWTAQMILAFNVMEEFYRNKGLQAKARLYSSKAEEYLSQLGNMVISSPSPSGQGEGCLPYATQEHVDTGHGWMTPKGKSTCSAAGTAYTLFAYYKHNPLKLQE
jgi:cell division protein FtsB